MNIFRNFLRALKAERVRAHQRWMKKNRVLILAKPKTDNRSSIELHKRILSHE